MATAQSIRLSCWEDTVPQVLSHHSLGIEERSIDGDCERMIPA